MQEHSVRGFPCFQGSQSAERRAHSTQHTERRAERRAHSTQHTAHSTQHTERRAQSAGLIVQVFVANPNKTKLVHDILLRYVHTQSSQRAHRAPAEPLCRNKERLVTYLSTFQNEKGSRSRSAHTTIEHAILCTYTCTEEEQFNEEKAFLVKQIKALV